MKEQSVLYNLPKLKKKKEQVHNSVLKELG